MPVVDTVFDVFVKTLEVIDVGAVQYADLLWVHYLGADCALIFCVIETHEDALLGVIVFLLVLEVELIIQYP